MGKSKKSKKVYSLTVYWPDKDPETIEGIKSLDIDEGGYAKWADPVTGLYSTVSGMPVASIETPAPDEPEEEKDEDKED